MATGFQEKIWFVWLWAKKNSKYHSPPAPKLKVYLRDTIAFFVSTPARSRPTSLASHQDKNKKTEKELLKIKTVWLAGRRAGSETEQLGAVGNTYQLTSPLLLSLWLSWGRSEPSLGRILRMKESLFVTLPPPENRMGVSGPALNPESCSSFCLWLAGALFPSPRERFTPPHHPILAIQQTAYIYGVYFELSCMKPSPPF